MRVAGGGHQEAVAPVTLPPDVGVVEEGAVDVGNVRVIRADVGRVGAVVAVRVALVAHRRPEGAGAAADGRPGWLTALKREKALGWP